jgi:hypothetical protein
MYIYMRERETEREREREREREGEESPSNIYNVCVFYYICGRACHSGDTNDQEGSTTVVQHAIGRGREMRVILMLIHNRSQVYVLYYVLLYIMY